MGTGTILAEPPTPPNTWYWSTDVGNFMAAGTEYDTSRVTGVGTWSTSVVKTSSVATTITSDPWWRRGFHSTAETCSQAEPSNHSLALYPVLRNLRY